MRLIDADDLARVKFHGYPDIEITPSDVNAEAYKRGWNDAINAIIECATTIDAVPVIRCKDCKHREAENGFCEGRGWPMQLVPDDGFCDKGERK